MVAVCAWHHEDLGSAGVVTSVTGKACGWSRWCGHSAGPPCVATGLTNAGATRRLDYSI